MKKKIVFFSILLVIVLILISGSQEKEMLLPMTSPESVEWSEYESNPIIQFGDVDKDMLWNDPTVIKDGGIYKMWMGAGEPFSGNLTVQIYYATSEDGLDWDINTKPVLTPTPDTWDSHGVETPSVIKVGDTYHMYYTGYDTDFTEARYSIGHATSKDGIIWNKDPNNPIISPHGDPLEWGFFSTAEPGIVYYEGTFYLYYASAKSNYPEYGSPFGILLATSKDGSNFKKHGAVHTLTSYYDNKTFRGYSTPMVYVSDGVFHMYHDVVYSPNGPDGFEQVAISTARSTDGKKFTEYETNIFTNGNKDWKNHSVLAPTALQEDGRIKLWFAGQKTAPGLGFDYGIGYAEKVFGSN